MTRLPFKTIDVFTSVPFKGNPVAVVLDARGLSAEQMQQIARWTNLSETTFVIPPTVAGADYRLRIFTPGAELPFAGHPTVGTAHALLEAGVIRPKGGVVVQECGTGLVKLKIEQGNDGRQWISFELPAPKITPLDGEQRQELEAILGAPLERGSAPCLIDVGARWVIARLPTARAVLDAEPDLNRMKLADQKGRHTGVVIFGRHGPDKQALIEVRAFAPAHGINEDPVCGSGNGAVAAYLRHTAQAEFESVFLATQGQKLGRAGVLRLSISPDAIHVGGNAVTCVDGYLAL
ncbi:PhzF family phenazine biosynthesis protein [Massilia endophytica]|uniref:PhzF family phenazine biosynthesis protein n=1 Tax=Massilia endophytica TaxID=2899220 RepID=UPI001E62AC3D|nr:PhzF family phenazine biosynthesis protein [Massilia endophytica]UGQ45900.1 PhzF family phenazine biosynthesis protein [Massilia endophytica]